MAARSDDRPQDRTDSRNITARIGRDLRGRISAELLSPESEKEKEKEKKAAADGARTAREGVASAKPGMATVATGASSELPLAIDPDAFAGFLDRRRLATAEVYRQIKTLKKDLTDFLEKQTSRGPSRLFGKAVNPSGRPAAGLTVTLPRPSFNNGSDRGSTNNKQIAWPTPSGTTDGLGVFTLNLPVAPLPSDVFKLRFQGGDGRSVEVDIKAALASRGDLGLIVLPQPLRPQDAKAVTGNGLAERPVSTTAIEFGEVPTEGTAPEIDLGEEGDTISFGPNRHAIDQFHYSVLVRLTDPLVGPAKPVLSLRHPGGGKYLSELQNLSHALDQMLKLDEVSNSVRELLKFGRLEFQDRTAIERPLDVSVFRDGIRTDPVSVPKASTLSVGYTVNARSTWIASGYSLGNLVYSLPLAPGEEQRVSVFERTARQTVSERESVTEEESVRQNELSNTSTDAVFTSAVHDTARGGSEMSSTSHVWGVGGGIGAGGLVSGVLIGGGAAGGYGGSNVSGNSEAWQNNSRDIVSNASEQLSANLSRQASMRREASRVGVRLASASERDEVATKVIANYNHSHALTMQYWEVLRHYDIRTQIEDVQLVLLVPMELVGWLPPGEPDALPSSAVKDLTRDDLLDRYGVLLRFLDVIADAIAAAPVPRHDHRRAIEVAETLTADPTVLISSLQGGLATTIDISLKATILPFEEMHARFVFRNGRRSRRVRLQGGPAPIPQLQFESFAQLEEEIRNRRQNAVSELKASITLGAGENLRDAVRLEIERNFRTFSYTTRLDLFGSGSTLGGLVDNFNELQRTYQPDDLEELAGPPKLFDVSAVVPFDDGPIPLVEAFTGEDNAIDAGRSVALPVLRLPPVLTFDDILKLEALFQHVVRNGVAYSRAVWTALSPDERAILLEPFTIGIPEGGFTDTVSEIPLLNCVTNRLLGFFGNCMIMPFQIPQRLADEIGKTSKDIQDALLKFHTDAFRQPQGSVSLPTRGVLAEAVLGTSNASEKIDLTRFWNWQDSPHQSATDPLTQLITKTTSPLLSSDIGVPSNLKPGESTLLAKVLEQLKGTGTAAAGTSLIDKLIPEGGGISTTNPNDITGLTQLGAVMAEAVKAAASAQKVSTEQGAGLGKTAMEKLPDALKAAADFNKAAEEKADAKDAESQAKTEADKAARDKALGSLLEGNASDADKATVSAIGAHGTPNAALAFAQSLLSDKSGGNPLNPSEQLNLITKLIPLQQVENQNYQLQLGLWSLSKALGLQVGDPPQAPQPPGDGGDDSGGAGSGDGSSTDNNPPTGPAGGSSDNPSDSPGE